MYASAREEGVPPGQIRVLLVGDSGVGKSTIAQLIANGSASKDVQRTIGCSVLVKLVTYPDETSQAAVAPQDFFVELWDVAGSDLYKDCRSIFYSQINGIIFVHDLSQRKTRTSLTKWAKELASLCTYSVPLDVSRMVPVPFLVIENKADLAPATGSSSNLVDVARHWVEKQGLLQPTDELPTYDPFPGSTKGLRAIAKDGDLDMDAIDGFFRMLIQRRYYASSDVQLSTYPYPVDSNVKFQSKQTSSMYNGSKFLSKSNSSRFRV